jgi:3-oxoacyl-[acyl-carrier-protein] synthase III
MPTSFNHVFIEATGTHLPGEPVTNDAMDDYIAPVNRMSKRIKQRILAENGIKTRHYAIDTEGHTTMSHSALAAKAVRTCLAQTHFSLSDVGMLSAGSSGGDALIPGFANMMQGELGAPPMETLSSLGVCVAGMTALKAAAQNVELGTHARALAVAAEMPSRMFKKSRFAPADYALDFNAHFLRWMLSDGAGAILLSREPKHALQNNKRLRVKWIHQKSFSGDYPVCMQLGLDRDGVRSFVDYDSAADAEKDGAMCIRQDIRLLPHLFDVSIHEFVDLHTQGWFDIGRISHFLCHYSSERFAPDVEQLLQKVELHIPRERWFSNLSTRGNTGAASIYIMLDEFLKTRTIQTGEQIFCFVPESGRFSAAYMLLEVEEFESISDAVAITPPHDPSAAPNHLKSTLTQLAHIWHEYRSSIWRTPLVQQIVRGSFSQSDYQTWTAQWTPQVREGSKWMREGIASLTGEFASLGDLIETHAGEEQNDFQILYSNYRQAGGALPIDALKRNPGGEALNSFLHNLAATTNPIGLLGAIYIIEGTGQRIVPHLLPLIKKQVNLPVDAFSFLEYHGANDEHHLTRWLQGLELALAVDPNSAKQIIDTAKRVAQLYHMQFEMILDN